jgi:CBS domain-containing protein
MRVAALVMRPAGEGLATANLATVDRWAFVSEALSLLLEPDMPAVAVTDHGRIIGTITRAEIEAELRRRNADEHVQPPTLGPLASRAAHRAAEAAAEGADRPGALGGKPAPPEDAKDTEQGDDDLTSPLQGTDLEVAHNDDDMSAQTTEDGTRLGAGPAMVKPSSGPPPAAREADDPSCPGP